MITDIQKVRFQRIRLTKEMKPEMELQYCAKCDWDAETTGGATWNNCPECFAKTERVKLTNEVMNLMNW